MASSAQPPRIKTRHAMSGYVYEYYFDRTFDAVYRFGIRSGPGPYSPALIEIDRPLLSRTAGRELSAVEEFAVAKLALFEAFDERPDPTAMAEPYRPPAEVLDRIVTELDLQ